MKISTITITRLIYLHAFLQRHASSAVSSESRIALIQSLTAAIQFIKE